MADHSISLAGTDIRYAELGGSGPPLVLLHGITDSLESYRPAAAKLKQAARVYAIDFRGHGRSAHTRDHYRVRDFAADVLLFLERVVGEPAVLAGHSLGGLVTSYIASRPGAALRGIFLEDPPLYRARMPAIKQTYFYPFFVSFREALRAHHANGESLDDLVEFVGNSPADSAGRTLLDAVGADAVRLRARQLRRMDPEALTAPIEGILFADFDPDHDLPKIVCDTHLLAGNEALGGAMTANDVEEVSTRIPRCTTVVWDDIGHMIHQQRPEPYADELISFLERVG